MQKTSARYVRAICLYIHVTVGQEKRTEQSGKGGKKMKKRNKVIIQILEIAVPILVSIPTTIITVLWLKGQL